MLSGFTRSTSTTWATSVAVATEPRRPNAATAPSRRVRPSSGTTRPGSIPERTPSPSQAGHAPWGLLKLNSLGSSGGSVMPSSQLTSRSLITSGPCHPSTSIEHGTVTALQGELDRVRDAALGAGLDHDSVHHHVEVVSLAFVEHDVVAEIDLLAVDPCAHEAVASKLFELRAEVALLASDDGRRIARRECLRREPGSRRRFPERCRRRAPCPTWGSAARRRERRAGASSRRFR